MTMQWTWILLLVKLFLFYLLLILKLVLLVLIGESNTGKSVLSKLLRAVYEPYECGIIQSCPGRHVSDFWLQDCTGKSIYICEELYINTKEISHQKPD